MEGFHNFCTHISEDSAIATILPSMDEYVHYLRNSKEPMLDHHHHAHIDYMPSLCRSQLLLAHAPFGPIVLMYDSLIALIISAFCLEFIS